MLAVCLGLIGGGVAGVVWWLKNTELPGDGLPAIVDHTSAPPAPGPEFDPPSAHMFNRIVQEFSALPLEEAAGPAPTAQCRDLSTDPRPEGTRHMCAIQAREGRSITHLGFVYRADLNNSGCTADPVAVKDGFSAALQRTCASEQHPVLYLLDESREVIASDGQVMHPTLVVEGVETQQQAEELLHTWGIAP